MTERNGTAAAGGLSSNRTSARAPNSAARPAGATTEGSAAGGAAGRAEPHILHRAERLTGRRGRVGTFRVWSRSEPDRWYLVAWVGDGGVCGCRGFHYRARCWHLELVAQLVEHEVVA